MRSKRQTHPANLVAIFLFLCLCQLQPLASAHQSVDSADISFIIKREVLHKIDSRIFGQFMERPSWGEIGVEGALIRGTRKLQPRVLELLKEMEIPIIRFPGGTDVDFLDWRDMVDNVPGRAAQRPVSTGHRGHKVTNNFGYDEFLQFCEDVDAGNPPLADSIEYWSIKKASVLAFAPVPALPTGAGKKTRELRIIIRHLLPTI